MGEWTTEQIKELLREECGLTDRQIDAWLTAHDAEVARAAAEEWGVYIYGDSRLYRVNPPTEAEARRESGLVAEPNQPVPVSVGLLMQNAVNHARHADRRKPEEPPAAIPDFEDQPPFPTIRKEDSNG